ncbi:energy-coupling factor ABC transporter ATP-binding protein [Clostridium sp.]|uniref:ABC transporter ATP-binding protein n=1 Tax=Clostridium sp. TaxID=1506 RepID=UPI00262DFA42|nr:energy-coupling factor ABC transporter ATP-binding protein [Clostridium sp.]
MQEILQASNVIFKSIIKYPEIRIEKGKFTFLQGPSGCGKSTLLKLFNGTLSADSGSILYNGQNIEGMNTILLRQEVLLVGQSVYLFQGTIEDNFKVYYGYRNLDCPSREEIKGFLSMCCADFPLDTICDTMSGGERQRVYISICVSLTPKVLMLDEPTSALDETSANNMIGNIKSFCKERNITLLGITHDTKLAEKYADNIIYFEGRME